jgi:hypothetical protein
MEPARQPADRDRVREAARSWYSSLARAARAGQAVPGCDPDAPAGCFGEGAYPDASSWPGGAARASLACGQPVAVADLRSGETVLDLGSGGDAQVGCITRAPSFAANREGLTRAGFAVVRTTSTSPAGDGVHAAIIHVTRP